MTGKPAPYIRRLPRLRLKRGIIYPALFQRVQGDLYGLFKVQLNTDLRPLRAFRSCADSLFSRTRVPCRALSQRPYRIDTSESGIISRLAVLLALSTTAPLLARRGLPYSVFKVQPGDYRRGNRPRATARPRAYPAALSYYNRLTQNTRVLMWSKSSVFTLFNPYFRAFIDYLLRIWVKLYFFHVFFNFSPSICTKIFRAVLLRPKPGVFRYA